MPLDQQILTYAIFVALIILGAVFGDRRRRKEEAKNAIIDRAYATGFEPVTVTCPKCGVIVGAYAYFCPSCGTRVETSEQKGKPNTPGVQCS